MSDTLKPCPFCGEVTEDASKTMSPAAHPLFVVRCFNCGASSGAYTKADAIAAWNRRATAPTGEPSTRLAGSATVRGMQEVNAARTAHTADKGHPDTSRIGAQNLTEGDALARRGSPAPRPSVGSGE